MPCYNQMPKHNYICVRRAVFDLWTFYMHASKDDTMCWMICHSVEPACSFANSYITKRDATYLMLGACIWRIPWDVNCTGYCVIRFLWLLPTIFNHCFIAGHYIIFIRSIMSTGFWLVVMSKAQGMYIIMTITYVYIYMLCEYIFKCWLLFLMNAQIHDSTFISYSIFSLLAIYNHEASCNNLMSYL